MLTAAVYVIYHKCHSKGLREPVPRPTGGLGHLEGGLVLHCVCSCRRAVFGDRAELGLGTWRVDSFSAVCVVAGEQSLGTGLSYVLFMPVFLRLPQGYILDSRGVRTHPTLCFHKTTSEGSLPVSTLYSIICILFFVLCLVLVLVLVWFFDDFICLQIHAEVNTPSC